MTGCATDAPNREAAWHPPPEAIHVGGDKGEKISPPFLQRSELSGHNSSALLFAVLLCERALSAPAVLLSGGWKSQQLAERMTQANASG